jgi:hypothetical protein
MSWSKRSGKICSASGNGGGLVSCPEGGTADPDRKPQGKRMRIDRAAADPQWPQSAQPVSRPTSPSSLRRRRGNRCCPSDRQIPPSIFMRRLCPPLLLGQEEVPDLPVFIHRGDHQRPIRPLNSRSAAQTKKKSVASREVAGIPRNVIVPSSPIVNTAP